MLCPACVGRPRRTSSCATGCAMASRGARTAAQARADEDRVMKEYYAARAAEYDDFYLGVGLDRHRPWRAGKRISTTRLCGSTRLPYQRRDRRARGGHRLVVAPARPEGRAVALRRVDEVLDRARDRLLAHGLRAHIHIRDAWAEPDRQVDALFCGGWLSPRPEPRLDEFLAICQRWLKPGGLFAFIDEAAERMKRRRSSTDRKPRELKDGREFEIIKVYYAPERSSTRR